MLVTLAHDVLLMISPNPPERFRGIARFAAEHGWYLSIEDRSSPPAEFSGDGVIVTLGRQHTALKRAVETYLKRGIPVVDLTFQHPEVAVNRVIGDNEAIGRLAAEHFKDHNFHHAAFFASHRGNVQRLRRSAFERAWEGEVLSLAGLTRAELAARLIEMPKPIAVFAYSDYDATRVLNACRDAKLVVPDEVAILGVDDNVPICENQPVPISSIRHDHETVGYEGAALLNRLMSATKKPRKAAPLKLIAPKGVAVRRSTDVLATGDPFVRQAIDLINLNISQNLTQRKLSEELKITEADLNARFRRELGCSPVRQIIALRLTQVKRLLTSTDYPLEAIAAETGFCHAAHLANAFRSAFGITPGEWRRLKQ